MSRWACYETGCGAHGTEHSRLQALIAFERHWIHTHYRTTEETA